MTDAPQWALERARELAAMWNDPGQGGAIARALAEAAKPKWLQIETAPMPEVGAPGYGARVLLAVDCGDGTVKGVRVGWWDGSGWEIDASYAKDLGYRVTHWMPLPAAPEVG